jgi:hypothetical protein
MIEELPINKALMELALILMEPEPLPHGLRFLPLPPKLGAFVEILDQDRERILLTPDSDEMS